MITTVAKAKRAQFNFIQDTNLKAQDDVVDCNSNEDDCTSPLSVMFIVTI